MAADEIPPGCCEYPPHARYRPTASGSLRASRWNPLGPDPSDTQAIPQAGPGDLPETYRATRPPRWFRQLRAEVFARRAGRLSPTETAGG